MEFSGIGSDKMELTPCLHCMDWVEAFVKYMELYYMQLKKNLCGE